MLLTVFSPWEDIQRGSQVSPAPDRTLADPHQVVSDLRRALAECEAERDAALAREAATAEVLQVINSSPGDLKPVFDAILEKAHSLCGAEYGVLFNYDGELFWTSATHGAPPGFPERQEGIRPGFGFTRLVRGERFLHIHDMVEDAAQRPDDPVPRATPPSAHYRNCRQRRRVSSMLRRWRRSAN